MNEDIKHLADRVVAKCSGNQEEAARQTGLSSAWFSRVRAGIIPTDVKSQTFHKLYTALGEEAPVNMVRETPSVSYERIDKAGRLATWLRAADPRLADAVYTVAQSHGFNDMEADSVPVNDRVKMAEEAIRRGEASIQRGMKTMEELKAIHKIS